MRLYRLFGRKVFHIQPDLERIKKALKDIGNPHEKFRSILISGTNGKGSTAYYIESLLRSHGLKTGLFTSPHILEENERWQINSTNIRDEILESYIRDLKQIIKKYDLTYFEASTLIAFKYFCDECVDTAVLEVGLGGRWDATNVVYPEVSVITNVSLDHTHILGNSLKDITEEKLGITRKDRPLVIGSDQIEIISQAVLKGIREIYHYPIGFTYHIKGNTMDYTFKDKKITDLKTSLIGERQLSNAATGLTAFLIYSEKAKIKVDEPIIKKALRECFIPGRMQVISEDPLVIVDGAHNEEALIKTLNEIKKSYTDKKIISIFSCMKDKNFIKLFSILRQNCKKIIATTIPVERSITEKEISQLKDIYFFKDLMDAFGKAVQEYDKETVILVTGSLYLVSEFLKNFDKSK